MLRRYVAILLPAAVALLAGCLDYDERIELNADGSGLVRIHLSISEQAMGLAGQVETKEEADLFPVPPDDFIKEMKKEKLEVQGLRAESSGGKRHFYIVIAFKDLQDLARSEYFGGRELVFEKNEDGSFRFRQTLDVSAEMSGDEKEGKDEKPRPEKEPAPKEKAPDPAVPGKPGLRGKAFAREMELDKERMKKIVAGASLTFSVELTGGHVLITDGRPHRQVVSVWNWPLEDLVDKKPVLKMEAVFSPQPPPPVEENP